MKNNFITKIIGATLAFAMMIGGAVGINAAKEAKEVNATEGVAVLAPRSVTSVANKQDDQGNTWVMASDAAGFTSNTSYIHAGSGKKSVSYLRFTTGAYSSYSIDSISLFGAAAASSGATLKIFVGGVKVAESDELENTSGDGGTELSWTNTTSANGEIKVEVSRASSATKALYFNQAIVNYSAGGNIESHTLTYAVGAHGTYDGTTTKSFTVAKDGTHTVLGPNDVGISGNTGYFFDEWNDGTNPYQIDATYTMGTSDVTLTAQWVAGVALSYNGNGAASGSTATTYVRSGETQTVANNGFNAPSGKQFKEWNTLSNGQGTSYNPGDEIENFSSSLELFAIWENQTKVTLIAGTDKGTSSGQNPDSVTKNDITLTCTSMYGTDNSAYRFYQNSTLTISRSSGKIASIEFTGVSSYPISRLEVLGGVGTLTTNGNDGVWEGASQSVSFNATAQARASKIVVNYYTGSDVDLNKDSLTLVVGGSSSTIAVSEISGITNPTYQWAASGDDCVTLTNTNTDTVTVAPKGSAFAKCTVTLTVNGDNLQEPIVREVPTYVARSSSENAYNIAEAKRAIDLNDELYINNARVSGIISHVEEYVEANKAINYWISDDGTRTNELEAFKGKGVDGADFSSAEDIDLGASVVVKGNLVKYGSTYELSTGNQMESYSITAEAKVEKLDSHASLSYKYTKTGDGILDTLTSATTGITGSSYSEWNGKTGASGAVYAGQSAADYSSIQLRSSNSNSGVVTTASGGNATKVTVSWNTNTANGRTINIYGKNTAYTAASDLYGNNSGTLLGTIVYGDSTEFEITDDYQFIGIRSASGALYLDEIKIQWGEPVDYTYSNVAIRFGGSITPELWDELDTNEHNIAGFGVAWKKAGAFEGLLKNNIANTETADGQGFYKLVTAKAEGHPDLVNGKYLWNFYLRIPTIISEVYDEQYFNDNITAVAYIKLNNGDVVFLKETTASIKSLAQALIDDDAYDYDNSSFEGSLKHLADYTGE